MNNNIETLPNGDFKVIYPDKKPPQSDKYRVVYWDTVMQITRGREFSNLPEALQFIELRINGELYKHFRIAKCN